jgi:hypothetical protein
VSIRVSASPPAAPEVAAPVEISSDFSALNSAARAESSARMSARAWARSAVLLIAGLVRADLDRALLAVADGAEPRRRHALADQEVLHRRRAPCAQRKVVFPRALFVGVAFDDRGIARVLHQPLRLRRQDAARYR